MSIWKNRWTVKRFWFWCANILPPLLPPAPTCAPDDLCRRRLTYSNILAAGRGVLGRPVKAAVQGRYLQGARPPKQVPPGVFHSANISPWKDLAPNPSGRIPFPPNGNWPKRRLRHRQLLFRPMRRAREDLDGLGAEENTASDAQRLAAVLILGDFGQQFLTAFF